MAELFEALPTQVSLPRQIQCARREVKQREYVYPRRVAAEKMKQSQADEEIAAMGAIVATLETHAKLVAFVEGIAKLTPGQPSAFAADTLDKTIEKARALTEKPS